MIRDDFWLDWDNALSRGIICQRELEFDGAEPDTETVRVPGRSGDIVYWDGAYKNVKGTASCYVLCEHAAEARTAIAGWLLHNQQYRRLETLSEPGIFRLARIANGGKLAHRLDLLAPFEIEFDCLPQKYLREGEEEREFTAAGVIVNPTAFEARPLLTVHGTTGAASVVIGTWRLSMQDADEIVIDCESMRCWKGSEAADSAVTFQKITPGGNVRAGAPRIAPGENSVRWSGAATGLTIVPRWWTL